MTNTLPPDVEAAVRELERARAIKNMLREKRSGLFLTQLGAGGVAGGLVIEGARRAMERADIPLVPSILILYVPALALVAGAYGLTKWLEHRFGRYLARVPNIPMRKRLFTLAPVLLVVAFFLAFNASGERLYLDLTFAAFVLWLGVIFVAWTRSLEDRYLEIVAWQIIATAVVLAIVRPANAPRAFQYAILILSAAALVIGILRYRLAPPPPTTETG